MVGTLGLSRATIEIGLHQLSDERTYNVEYRNRFLHPYSMTDRSQPIRVHALGFDVIDWQALAYPLLQVNPREQDNVTRLGNALNFLSMYESGIAEMLTLINIRQNQLSQTELKVIPYKPIAFLTSVTGKSEPAVWSATSLYRTTWT